MEAVRRNRNINRSGSVIGNEWLKCANQTVYGSVFTMRVPDRAIEFWGSRSEDAEKGTHIQQTTHNLSSVHYEKSVVTFRDESMRTQLYSKYNRQVIATDNALNFNSILILPPSGCDVCPCDAP